jgi:hypothetical protein
MREEGNLSGILDLFNDLPALEQMFSQTQFNQYTEEPTEEN